MIVRPVRRQLLNLSALRAAEPLIVAVVEKQPPEGGRARLSNRSSNRGPLGATGADAASATSRRELTTSSTILDASGSFTGVDAVHTVPVQWLNTRVEEPGCQVTRRKRSAPRASVNVIDRPRFSSTNSVCT